jgi:hypothetical protein
MYAKALLLAALSLGIVTSSPVSGGATPTSPRRVVTRGVAEADSAPGTARNPILLSGTEIAIVRHLTPPPRDAFALRLGKIAVSLCGDPLIVLPPGAEFGVTTPGTRAAADDPATMEANVYSDGEITIAVGPSWSARVESRYVLLRDPLNPTTLTRSKSAYWAPAMGIGFRF